MGTSLAEHTAATTLLDLFAAQVDRQPDGIALRHRGSTVTYAELDRWVASIHNRLDDSRVRSGDLVALTVERSPAMIAAVLGVIRAGAGYLALDPQTPDVWRRAVLEQASPRCLLTDAELSTADRSASPLSVPPDDAVFQVAATSGTTGTPRLVRIPYRAMVNRLAWMWRDHPFEPGSVVAVQKSPALVASPWEMLGGLLTGTPSVVLAREQVVDPLLLAEAITEEGITHLYLTPHLIAGLLDAADRGALAHNRMRLVTSGADALPPALALRFRDTFPNVRLLNLYGTTETASNIAAYDTGSLPGTARRVPVGRPVAGAGISVLDGVRRPVPIGVTGEVWVSGPPLALGYLGDETRTAQRFLPQPDGTTRYRTGDRGRWLPDGTLEVLGRTDNQLKIRGYRVELEEIEAALTEAPGVTGAGAFAVGGEDPAVVGCVTGTEDLTALRAHLHDRLPDYLIPSRLLHLPELPRNTNGKVNRAELARLTEDASPAAPVGTYDPTDPREQRVVACWTEILGTAPRDATQSFFEAGGHSLLAVRLIGALEKAFGRRVPLRAIFEDSSITGIARHLTGPT